MSGIVVTSNVLPFTPEHYRWAQSRPVPDRTRLPAFGDQVMYRHDEAGPVFDAEVVEPPGLEDLSDPNVWRWHSALVDGRRVLGQVVDPWPELILKVDFPTGPRTGRSREARLPLTAGWLPTDWQTRETRLLQRWGVRL